MSEVILDWVDEGLDIDKFHIVGHSLGGECFSNYYLHIK